MSLSSRIHLVLAVFAVLSFALPEAAHCMDGPSKHVSFDKGNHQAGVTGSVAVLAREKSFQPAGTPVGDPGAKIEYSTNVDLKLFGGSFRVLGFSASAESNADAPPEEGGFPTLTNPAHADTERSLATCRLTIGGVTVATFSDEVKVSKNWTKNLDTPVYALEKTFVTMVGPVPLRLKATVGSGFEGKVEAEASYPVRGSVAVSFWSQGAADVSFDIVALRLGVNVTLQLLRNTFQGNLFADVSGLHGNVELIQEAVRILLKAYVTAPFVRWDQKSNGWLTWWQPRTEWKEIASLTLVDYTIGKLVTPLFSFGRP